MFESSGADRSAISNQVGGPTFVGKCRRHAGEYLRRLQTYLVLGRSGYVLRTVSIWWNYRFTCTPSTLRQYHGKVGLWIGIAVLGFTFTTRLAERASSESVESIVS